MATGLVWIAALSLAAWVYLVFAHGRFWLCDQRMEGREPAPAHWPAIVAVVPARDEADVLPEALRSLLAQDYPGELRVVLVDDESSDGTGEVARGVARAHANGHRLAVVATPPRPPGWVGKMWAVASGVRAAEEAGPAPEAWLFTDADVVPGRDSLRRLAARAQAEGLDLVSLMVRLEAGRGIARLLVPAFVYFFQKLYPFPRVNDPRARTAAAAGGCVLVRRDALARAGGIESLRAEVIDDCALGRAVKRSGGRLWLGLSATERSIRPYAGLDDVWQMVARSAFTQLHHSSLLLAGTLTGLALLYLVPPLWVLGLPLHGDLAASARAAGAWLLAAASFTPTLALYGRAAAWALALPLAGALYAGMTLDSARRHWRNEGASWKGRTGAGRR
jgi:hopene-associated glycosyltransferase HpnB